jgi:exopolysaccharide production protein ExoZ
MVLFFHARYNAPGAENWPRFGAAGVDIFFVISGFVMAHTTRRLSDQSSLRERANAGAYFLGKRLVRIVPLYWLAVLWTARREIAQGQMNIDLVKDLAFVPRWSDSTHAMTPILVQGWTLNYEMFFYLLFAGALLFGRWRAGTLILLLMVLVALGTLLSPADLLAQFYTKDLMLEFGYGVLLYRMASARGLPDWPRWAFLLIAATAFALLATMGSFESLRSVSIGLPALVIVWASLGACGGWLRSRALQLMGDASYAIYLFHWGAFGAIKPLVAWFGPPPSTLQVALLMAALIATAVLSGIAVHLWVERPILLWARGGLDKLLAFSIKSPRPASSA